MIGTRKLLVQEHGGPARYQAQFDKALRARVVEITGVLTTQLLTSWERTREPGEEVDVLDDMQDLAMRVIGMALFSRDIGSALREAVRSGAAVDRFVYERIDERLVSGGDYDDILSELIRAYGDDAPRLRRELRDQIVTLFFAGVETTAVALAWTWLLLSQNPEVEARFHEEIDTVLGGRAPAPEDLKALAYTSQVIQESLRIYPPGCPEGFGAAFATVEMLTVLAVAGQRVRLWRTADGPVTAAPPVTQRPAAGLRMHVAARP